LSNDKNNLNANDNTVGQDSETKITEHCPKNKVQCNSNKSNSENRPNIKTNKHHQIRK